MCSAFCLISWEYGTRRRENEVETSLARKQKSLVAIRPSARTGFCGSRCGTTRANRAFSRLKNEA